MTEILSSRIAGLKLGGIVTVLLLPMLVLSFFMMRSLRQDMTFAEREMDGIAFNRIVQPVMLGMARGKASEADMLRLRKEGSVIARRLGLDRQISTAIATYYSTGSDKRYAIKPFADLLAEAAAKSNIILDPYAETYYLGSIVGLHAPGLLADYVETLTRVVRALRDGTVLVAEEVDILMAAGNWQESQERMAETYVAASESALNAGIYKDAIAHSTEMMRHPGDIADLLGGTGGGGAPDKAKIIKAFDDMSARIGDELNTTWTAASVNFERLISARLNNMKLQLGLMAAIAAAACLIGVGSAALMFRSTLRQLDSVQTARYDAERARAEAETSASELRRVSEDIIRLNRDLSDNLSKLRDAQDDLLRKGRLSQLGQLTATVAHELRNPLGAVRTSAFLLERKVKDKGLGVEPQLQRISNGITRCDNIITQLLDFARTRALNAELIDFDNWLEQVLIEEAPKLPEAVAIDFDPGLGGKQVKFDAGRLTRVIINLVSNASEAMVGNGAEPAKFTTPTPMIGISTAFTARGLEISVRDNGPGMSEDVRKRALEPLFTTKSFGTGLGLPAVEKILQEHGGGMDIVTAPGAGTTITGWFPLDELASAAA